jgi:tRNA1Val (adenine37-N6)-methyltransferase
MKVGTDAVLLGAWATVNKYPDAILDIGAGTGVISLMLAQRSDAMTIDAVEIDEQAHEQCVENFELSDWGDRLFCYNTSFDAFVEEMVEEEEQYDLIISNPPFYTDAFETEDDSRNKARFTSSLSFETLVSGVSKLLSETGVFSVIIPFKEEINFIKLAKNGNLCLNRVCRVKGNVDSEVKRSLLEFSFKTQDVVEGELTIEKTRHNYTKEYIELTKDFYLKM